MNILVVAPMEQEQKNFKRALESRECKHRYKTICSGIGKANAASSIALEVFNGNYDLVAIIGYAASSKLFERGDVVIPSYAKYHDVDIPAGLVDELTKTYYLDGSDDVTILTGDSFITKEKAIELQQTHGVKVIFDMEATAVAQVCEEANLDLIVLKMISDIPEEDGYESFTEFVEKHNDFACFLSYLELLD